MSKPFYQYGISDDLCRALSLEDITVASPIQDLAIPPVMAGSDLIGEAQTGTGKTMAFLVPIFEQIDPKNDHLQAMIIAPTRELAIQITEEARKLQKGKDISVLAAYGGQDIFAQMHKLKNKVQLVIGTTGRLLDHIRRQTLDLKHLKFLVLDEADQMLHMGFLPDVEMLIKKTPETRQTLCFSATMTEPVRKLASRYMKAPVRVKVEAPQITLEAIDQYVVETTDRGKFDDFERILREDHPFMGIIFCRTKMRCSRLAENMIERGYNCEELHGDLTQAKREKVMKSFRALKIQYLIATDVAARGLDIEGVTHIFNYDMPMDVDSYIHRIGRTGRMGKSGRAYTFATPKDKQMCHQIEKETQQVFKKRVFKELPADSAHYEKEHRGEHKPKQGHGERRDPRDSRDSGRKRDFGGKGRGGSSSSNRSSSSKDRSPAGKGRAPSFGPAKGRGSSSTARGSSATARGSSNSANSSGRRSGR